jgi:hypothetical protein
LFPFSFSRDSFNGFCATLLLRARYFFLDAHASGISSLFQFSTELDSAACFVGIRCIVVGLGFCIDLLVAIKKIHISSMCSFAVGKWELRQSCLFMAWDYCVHVCETHASMQGWEVQGLGPRVKVLRFAFLCGKRFEVQGSACQENFFKV